MDLLNKWKLSLTPVLLTPQHFNLRGETQARKPWPGRTAGKVESLRNYGWMTDQYAYGIAPQGAKVVDGKLILPAGVSHVSCVNPMDGVHRLTAATELQEQTGHKPCKVPTILFEFGIPHSVWLPFAFARMEMNQYSDMYTTVDLLHVIQLVEKNREDSGLSDTPNPKDIHEAIYGKSLENNEAPSSQSTLFFFFINKKRTPA